MDNTKNLLKQQYQEALITAGIKAANYLAEKLTKVENQIISTNQNQDYKADLALKLLEIIQQSSETNFSQESQEDIEPRSSNTK